MPSNSAVTDWPARFAALSEKDGDEWAAELQQLVSEWLAAYRHEFVEFALSRNWQREDAETWAHEIAEEAYTYSYDYDHCPRRMAKFDVVECEEPE